MLRILFKKTILKKCWGLEQDSLHDKILKIILMIIRMIKSSNKHNIQLNYLLPKNILNLQYWVIDLQCILLKLQVLYMMGIIILYILIMWAHMINSIVISGSKRKVMKSRNLIILMLLIYLIYWNNYRETNHNNFIQIHMLVNRLPNLTG